MTDQRRPYQRRGPKRSEVRPSVALVPLPPEQLASLNEEDKHAEAWLLHCQGRTQAEIAERFAVSRSLVQKWLKAAVVERRRRVADVDEAIEHSVTVIEHVVVRAMRAFEESDKDSLAAPNYLRLALDGAKELLRIRGLDKPGIAGHDGGSQTTEIVLEIGGETKARVGVRQLG